MNICAGIFLISIVIVQTTSTCNFKSKVTDKPKPPNIFKTLPTSTKTFHFNNKFSYTFEVNLNSNTPWIILFYEDSDCLHNEFFNQSNIQTQLTTAFQEIYGHMPWNKLLNVGFVECSYDEEMVEFCGGFLNVEANPFVKIIQRRDDDTLDDDTMMVEDLTEISNFIDIIENSLQSMTWDKPSNKNKIDLDFSKPCKQNLDVPNTNIQIKIPPNLPSKQTQNIKKLILNYSDYKGVNISVCQSDEVEEFSKKFSKIEIIVDRNYIFEISYDDISDKSWVKVYDAIMASDDVESNVDSL